MATTIDPEDFGQLLAKLAEVERSQLTLSKGHEDIKTLLTTLAGNQEEDVRQHLELKHQIEQLGISQDQDVQARNKVLAWWGLGRLMMGFAVVVCLPMAGWVGSMMWADYQRQNDRLSELRDTVRSTEAELERHEAGSGHEGTRTLAEDNRRSIATLEARLAGIERQQEETNEATTEILHALRTRRDSTW